MYCTPIFARLFVCACVHMAARMSGSISIDYCYTPAVNCHFSLSSHGTCFWYANKLFQQWLLNALYAVVVFYILNALSGLFREDDGQLSYFCLFFLLQSKYFFITAMTDTESASKSVSVWNLFLIM